MTDQTDTTMTDLASPRDSTLSYDSTPLSRLRSWSQSTTSTIGRDSLGSIVPYCRSRAGSYRDSFGHIIPYCRSRGDSKIGLNDFNVWVGTDKDDQRESHYPKGHKLVKLKKHVPEGMTDFGIWVGDRRRYPQSNLSQTSNLSQSSNFSQSSVIP